MLSILVKKHILLISKYVFCFSHQASQILCAVLSHSDEYIITGTAGNDINVIRIETGEIVHTGNKHVDAVTALAITKDDTILISGTIVIITYQTK